MKKDRGLQYIVWGAAIGVLGASLYFSYYLYRTTENEMAAQFNNQQLILAQEAATGIEEYLGSLRRNMLVLKQLFIEDISLFERVSKTVFQKFRDTALADVWVVTDEGVVKSTITHPQLQGHSIANTPYFIKAQESFGNSIYTSGVFKLGGKNVSVVDNKWIILTMRLTTTNKRPEQKEDFLVFLVSVNKINSKFVFSIRSGKTGYAWVLDDIGVLLHHPEHPEMIDRSIFAAEKTCFDCHLNAFVLEKKIVKQTTQGKTRYLSAAGVNKLIAYSPIYLGSHHSWTIAVTAPYTEVTFLLRESFYQLAGLLIVISLTTLTVTIVVLRINKKRLVAESKAIYARQLEKEVAERTHEFKQEKQKLDDIVSAIGARLFVINNDMKIIWVNKNVSKEFSNISLKSRFCYQIFYQRQEPCIKCPALRTFEDGKFHQMEQLYKSGDKKAYHQVTTTPIYGASGEVEQVLELTQDITLQKHQEQNLIDSKKMLAVGQIAIGLAHDLGNPLSIIAGSTQFCLKNLNPPKEIREHLNVVNRNVTASGKVIKALLQFARPSEDSVMTAVKLPEVIQRTLLLLSTEINKKHVKVIENYPKNLPSIHGDKSQLEQVFVNVILNSLEAMSNSSGEIKINARPNTERKHVCLSFSDNGPGVIPDNLENVFDPFFTTRVRGVGLGLSISKRIIESHHGTIKAENLAKGGAKITICLPFFSLGKEESKDETGG